MNVVTEAEMKHRPLRPSKQTIKVAITQSSRAGVLHVLRMNNDVVQFEVYMPFNMHFLDIALIHFHCVLVLIKIEHSVMC